MRPPQRYPRILAGWIALSQILWIHSAYALRSESAGESATLRTLQAGLEETSFTALPLRGLSGRELMDRLIRIGRSGDPVVLDAIEAGFADFAGAPIRDPVSQESRRLGQGLARDLNSLKEARPKSNTSPAELHPAPDTVFKGYEYREKGPVVEVHDETVDKAELESVKGRYRWGRRWSDEEERVLFKGLHAGNLTDAERAELYHFLILVNKPLVYDYLKKKGYTRRYSPMEFEDLEQIGALGLMKAVARFDPDRGTRFSTVAYWWIRSALSDAQEHSQPIHIYRLQREAFQAAVRKLEKKLGREPTDAEMAKELGWDELEVARVKAALQIPLSYELLPKDSSDAVAVEELPEGNLSGENQRLLHLLARLSLKERIVLKMHYGIGTENGPYTLKEIGRRLGIGKTAIHQVQKSAQEQLRDLQRIEALSGRSSDDHADVYLFEVMKVPLTSPLFPRLLRLGRENLEQVGAALGLSAGGSTSLTTGLEEARAARESGRKLLTVLESLEPSFSGDQQRELEADLGFLIQA
ncbi:MAG: sigma-70 family RNA polymerase sigma factor [Candidatus Omnitrophica bacterium]|nr:sigma-70 family RNA polymerase sigma factor [Candidatus Omnitrophota bacterium]